MGNPNIKDYGFGGKNRTKKQDDEYRSRIKGVPRKRKWTKEACQFQLEDLMDILRKKIDNDNFKELSIIIDKMMDITRYLYPPVQQSVNVNLDITTDAVVERLKDFKKEQLIEVVVDEVKEVEDGRVETDRVEQD